VAGATVALTGVHVCVFIDVFALIMNHRYSPKILAIFEWNVLSKSVGLDGQRLFLVVAKEVLN